MKKIFNTEIKGLKEILGFGKSEEEIQRIIHDAENENFITDDEFDQILEDRKVELEIVLKDGGYELNEFNLEEKIVPYLKHLKEVCIQKHERPIGSNKKISIQVGNMLTFEAITAGLDLPENDFFMYVKKRTVSVVSSKSYNQLITTRNRISKIGMGETDASNLLYNSLLIDKEK
jgi:hypothetical protein